LSKDDAWLFFSFWLFFLPLLHLLLAAPLSSSSTFVAPLLSLSHVIVDVIVAVAAIVTLAPSP
jgi:hypothetical protein